MEECAALYRERIAPTIDREEARRILGGWDLACWCPEGQPCHADTLLEIANP